MSALPFEFLGDLPGDQLGAEEPPPWSGKFVEFIPRTVGLMLIHADDTRHHPFPPGWHPTRQEPVYLHDVELWPLACTEGEDELLFDKCFGNFLDGKD